MTLRRSLLCAGAALAVFVVSCSSPEERLARHLQRADGYLAEQKTREALIELRNALKLDPQSADINYRIAEVAEQLGAFGDALYYYAEVRRLDPERSDATLAEARLAMGDDPERAEALIRGVLEKHPEDVTALLRLSDVQLIRKEVLEARKTVWKAMELAPDDYRVHLQEGMLLRARVRGMLLSRKGKRPKVEYYDRAIAAFERGIERMNDETPPEAVVRAWVERARVMASAKELQDQAPEAFKKAAEVADRWPERKLRGAVYRATLEYARGPVEPELQRWAIEGLLQLFPGDYAAWMDLARLEELTGGSQLDVLQRLVTELPADPQAHAIYGRALNRDGKHAEAIAALTAALEQVGAKGPLYGTLVELRLGAGELEEARALLETMRSELPDAPQTRFAAAQIALTDRLAENALTELDRINVGFDNVRVQTLRVEAEVLAGRHDKALAAVNRAIELSGEAPAPQLLRRRAQILRDKGDWQGTLTALRALSRRTGDRLLPEDTVLAAHALYELGRDEQGRRLLEGLLELEAPPVAAVLEYAQRERARNPERVAKELDAAGAREPGELRIVAQLLQRDLAAGQEDAAVARIDRALEKNPESPVLLFMKAQVLAAKGDPAGAADLAQRALDRAPTMDNAALLLANSLDLQGRRAEAVAALEAHARVGALGTGAKALLARLHARDGDSIRAIALFEEVLRERSDLPQVKTELAFLLVRQGLEVDRALTLAQEGQAALPESPDAADVLGLTYLRKGMAGPASEQIRFAIGLAEKRGEARPGLHFHLALALRELGRNDEARMAIEKALASAVEFPEQEEARKTLEELRAASVGEGGEDGAAS